MEQVEQSAQVREVLDSKEFRTWLPEKRAYIELPRITHFWTSAFLSLGLGSVFTLVFIREYQWYFLSIILSTTLLMIAYAVKMGYGETRILLADKEIVEICTMKEKFIKCRWEDILEVRKIKSGGFEIITADGIAKVWWSPIPIGKAYSIFFLQVFMAMAGGICTSKLGKYKLPIELEVGQRYVYNFKTNKKYLYMTLMAGFLMAPGTLYKIGHHVAGDQYWVVIAFPAMFLCLHLLETYVTATSKSGDVVEVNNAEIIVRSKRRAETYEFKKLNSSLMPSLEPVPFEGGETFGNDWKSVQVDRRFLEEFWEPTVVPSTSGDLQTLKSP